MSTFYNEKDDCDHCSFIMWYPLLFMDIKGGELKKLSQKNVLLEIVLQKISLVVSCSIVH